MSQAASIPVTRRTTLGYQVYDLAQSDSETDDFGRTGYVWEVDGDAITDT